MPFTVVDKGPTAFSGTADDQNLTFYGIPNGRSPANFPTNAGAYQNAAQNDGTYKTFEVVAEQAA